MSAASVYRPNNMRTGLKRDVEIDIVEHERHQDEWQEPLTTSLVHYARPTPRFLGDQLPCRGVSIGQERYIRRSRLPHAPNLCGKFGLPIASTCRAICS
jgi:hypothetical protein